MDPSFFPDRTLAETTAAREGLRFLFVDEQGWDASCGWAALASLLRRYRARPVTEDDLRRASGLDATGKAQVNLKQLAFLAEGQGLSVRAWRCRWGDLPALVKASAPLLVHYDRPEPHFALLAAVGPRGAVTADPARGLEVLTRAQFEARWSGVAAEVIDLGRPGLGAAEAARAAAWAWGRADLAGRALRLAPPFR